MKVLVLAPRMQDVGGVQRYTRTMIRSLGEILSEKNIRVVELHEDSNNSREDGRVALVEKGRFTGEILRVAVGWRPDLIMCAHVGLAPIGWALGPVIQRPYWVIAYGIETWAPLPPFKEWALRGASKVVAISEFTRNRLMEQHGVSAQRIAVLPCAIDERLLSLPSDGGLLRSLGLLERRVVLTVGRLASSERYKGHDVVLRALPAVLKAIPEVLYLIVGDGDDRERLSRLARAIDGHRSTSASPSVVFCGRLGEPELAGCYRSCDVFAMPARTVLGRGTPKGEGFGLALLEAMAFGKPVVGPNRGAPIEFIRDGEHGFLVDPENPDAVAAALIELLTSPDLARQMGEAARAWVQAEYSIARFRERLSTLLNGARTTTQESPSMAAR